MTKLSKTEKVWEELFRPSCFGIRIPLYTCVNKYRERPLGKRVIPCEYFGDCIKQIMNEMNTRKIVAKHFPFKETP